MEQRSPITRILVALFLLAGPAAGAEGKHLFLLSGQSNMARFNEKASFVPAIEKAFGADRVVIVKDAQGGQPIRRWFKGWKGEGKGKKQEIGDLYDRMMNRLAEEIEGERIESVTFLWMQGEQDAREPTGNLYEESLLGLFEQLKSDLGRDDVNFVIGRLSDFGVGDSQWPFWEPIREAQVKVAEADPRIDWVDTDNLNDGTDKKGEPITNGLHYTREGYALFGERLAEAAIQLVRVHMSEEAR